MIVSLGSINADFLVRADRSPSGPGSVLARDLLRTSGGKAANVAVLAARLGATTRLLGTVGADDLAEQALRGPRAAGVDVSRVRRTSGATGFASIVVPPDGAKTIVLATNANDSWDDEAALDGGFDETGPGSVLVADLEAPTAVVLAALRLARDRGLATVLDPAPAGRVTDAHLAVTDHLTPDHREAEELTGRDIRDDGDACAAAHDLRRRGPRHVYVKLSSGGCAVSTPTGTAVVQAPEVAAVDQTGAGDAFAGALAWALLHGADPFDAARTAVAASTIAVTGYGSQESYPSPEELRAMEARVSIRGG